MICEPNLLLSKEDAATIEAMAQQNLDQLANHIKKYWVNTPREQMLESLGYLVVDMLVESKKIHGLGKLLNMNGPELRQAIDQAGKGLKELPIGKEVAKLVGTIVENGATATEVVLDLAKQEKEFIASGEGLFKFTENAFAKERDFIQYCKDCIKKVKQGPKIGVENGWNMSINGSMINGRYYTIHALERMAPATAEVIKELETRALKRGFAKGSKDFKSYVDARNISPLVIENTIKTGVKTQGRCPCTFQYQTNEVTIITNSAGDIMTVYPFGFKSKL